MERVTVSTYNLIAQEYDKETKVFWLEFPTTIIKNFADDVRGKVLDIGSGPGRDGIILRDSGLEVICLDASGAMVKITREKGLETVQADFASIPFDKNFFGGVWAYTSLLHIPKTELPAALIEAKRVLMPNGIFGLGFIEGDSEGWNYSQGNKLPRYFSYFKRAEIESLLEGTGLDIFYFEEFQPRSRNYLNYLCRKTSH